jgi:transglutaminase-like putative cysteine protease
MIRLQLQVDLAYEIADPAGADFIFNVHATRTAHILAVQHWVQEQVTFASKTTYSNTSAVDTLVERVGVCRGFAHLMIAMCRALNIPARIATGTDYGADPALGPPDYHAYVEVYLADRWYVFDASGSREALSTTAASPGAVSGCASFGGQADVAMATRPLLVQAPR